MQQKSYYVIDNSDNNSDYTSEEDQMTSKFSETTRANDCISLPDNTEFTNGNDCQKQRSKEHLVNSNIDHESVVINTPKISSIVGCNEQKDSNISHITNNRRSNSIKKRKNTDEYDDETVLEAEIKRVALDDDNVSLGNEKKFKQMKSNFLGESTLDHDSVLLRILCSAKEASYIVGPKGSYINKLKSVTQTQVYVSENKEGVHDRVISIKGTLKKVLECSMFITQRFLDPSSESFVFNEIIAVVSQVCSLSLLVPHELAGFIIGKGGLNLKKIETSTNCKISVSTYALPFSNDRLVKITGTMSSIHGALSDISKILIQSRNKVTVKNMPYIPQPTSHSNDNNVSFPSSNYVQHTNFTNNRQKNNITGPINERNEDRFIIEQRPIIIASQEQLMNRGMYVTQASHMNQPLQLYSPSPNPIPLNPYSVTPYIRIGPYSTGGLGIVHHDCFILNAYVGKIIGKGGRNIKNIKESSGSEIIIEQESSAEERKFTIIGTPMSNQIALAMLNKKIESILRS